MTTIVLFGGGRWARVFVEVLKSLPLGISRIFVCSPHNASSMQKWVDEKGFADSVQVQISYPVLQDYADCFALVVNAAKDHQKAVEHCIAAGTSVLVEKPFTLTYGASLALLKRAREQGTFLATAHVFLFARYLDNFAKCCANIKSVEGLHLHWEDPRGESRYGERKQYDSSLPIIHDLLPHVVSVLLHVLPGRPLEFLDIMVSRGGSEVIVSIKAGNIPCTINLIRNGTSRKRVIEVVGLGDNAVLDFSAEPGTIEYAGEVMNADLEWGSASRPLATMLNAFFVSANGPACDPRLDPQIAIVAAQITEVAYEEYRKAQQEWFDAHQDAVLDEAAVLDMEYACSERAYGLASIS